VEPPNVAPEWPVSQFVHRAPPSLSPQQMVMEEVMGRPDNEIPGRELAILHKQNCGDEYTKRVNFQIQQLAQSRRVVGPPGQVTVNVVCLCRYQKQPSRQPTQQRALRLRSQHKAGQKPIEASPRQRDGAAET